MLKFLQKLAYCGAVLVGLMAAKADDAPDPKRAAVATQVTCGGVTWTHDEFLGNFNGQAVYTIIKENRIYIRWNGNSDPTRINNAFDNTGILLHLDTNRFPNDVTGNAIVNGCVNSIDPSVMGNNYLQPAVTGGIPCNNKVIGNNVLLGTYIGGDAVKTFQYAMIVDGLLRVNFHREGTTRNVNQLSLGLIGNVINGENGSFLNPSLGYTLNLLEVQSCFWGDAPKTATPVGTSNNCGSGPTLGAISNLSATGLRFAYTGTGVSTISWRIKSGGTVVRSATTGTLASTNVDITYASLSNGTYTLEIEGGNCTSSVSSSTFTVSGGACGRGPTLGTISNVSQTGLRFQFDGDGVPNIKWRIKSGGNEVRSATTPALTSATVDITYASLAAGTYTLEIEGGSCTSAVSSSSFTITSGPCTSGPTISSISAITASSLSVAFTGTGISTLTWRVKSGANILASGTTASSSNTATITFSNLANGAYTLEIQGGNCTSAVSTQAFTVAVTDTRPTCTTGTNLVAIYTPTSVGMTFNFFGQNVPSIDWKIKSGSNILRQNRVTLVNDRPNISYDEIPDGEYTLEIQGGACKSATSSQTFTIVGSSLPIYISGFSGVSLANGIELNWNVVEEKDGAGFEVIRYDGNAKSPQVIKNVPLTDGRLGKYSVVDENPALGNNYYQLKMIDKDGSSKNSSIIAVKYDQILASIVAPNPAREYVNVEFTSRVNGACIIETYNMSGRKMQSINSVVKSGRNKINVNTSALADGHYFVKVIVDGEEVNLRFVKSK